MVDILKIALKKAHNLLIMSLVFCPLLAGRASSVLVAVLLRLFRDFWSRGLSGSRPGLFCPRRCALAATPWRVLLWPDGLVLVPVVGLEPTRPGGQQSLSLSRLPIPTHRPNAFLLYHHFFNL